MITRPEFEFPDPSFVPMLVDFFKGTNYWYWDDFSLSDMLFFNQQEHVHQSSCFPCNRCGRTYRYKRNLQQHEKNECGREPSHQCPVCPYRTKQKGTLKIHFNIKHS
uniref:Longitudinals lacking protein, isoform G n=1 Tax=Cacopsylla melanoneura TaxID=428564 RepID=A0A8D9DPJ0_9HEMI